VTVNGTDLPTTPDTTADAPPLNHYAVGVVRLDLLGSAVEVDLPHGARVVGSYTVVQQASPLLTRAVGAAHAQQHAVPMLVIAFDPKDERPKQRRRFVAMPVGSAVATDQLLEPVATFGPDGGGMVFALFEARDRPATGEVQDETGSCPRCAAEYDRGRADERAERYEDDRSHPAAWGSE